MKWYCGNAGPLLRLRTRFKLSAWWGIGSMFNPSPALGVNLEICFPETRLLYNANTWHIKIWEWCMLQLTGVLENFPALISYLPRQRLCCAVCSKTQSIMQHAQLLTTLTRHVKFTFLYSLEGCRWFCWQCCFWCGHGCHNVTDCCICLQWEANILSANWPLSVKC